MWWEEFCNSLEESTYVDFSDYYEIGTETDEAIDLPF